MSTNIDAISIADAYAELTRNEFAVWIRMMTMDDDELIGRKKTCERLGYKESRGSAILTELKYKKYISVTPTAGVTSPSRIEVVKRAKISGPNRFVNLANTMLDSPTERPITHKCPFYRTATVSGCDVDESGVAASSLNAFNRNNGQTALSQSRFNQNQSSHDGIFYGPNDNNNFHYPKYNFDAGCDKLNENNSFFGEKEVLNCRQANTITGLESLDKTVLVSGNKTTKKRLGRKIHAQSGNLKASNIKYNALAYSPIIFSLNTDRANTVRNTASVIVGEKNTKTNKKINKNKRIDNESLTEQKKNAKAINKSKKTKKSETKKTKGVDLNKIKKIHKAIKKERSDVAKRREKKKKENKNKRCVQPNIDWDKLDQWGNPAISFSPKKAERQKMIEILNRTEKNPTRKAIMKKLGSEFGRIYSTYRRLLQKQSGIKPNYMLIDKERKYAAKAGAWCIMESVTPRTVLTYWHFHISNFAEQNMKIPPLVFLSSPANIATVAHADFEPPEAGWKAGQPKIIAHRGNSFSDLRLLDGRLRPLLLKKGFDLTEWTDEYLLTIQHSADSLAQGHNLFMDDEILAMAKAAKVLYTGSK
jgi:hypothetical protein